MRKKSLISFFGGFGLTLAIALFSLAIIQVSPGIAASIPAFGNLRLDQVIQNPGSQTEDYQSIQSNLPQKIDPAAQEATHFAASDQAITGGGLIGQILSIPAAQFHADGAKPDSMFFPFGCGYWEGDSTNYGCMIAPAYLPDNQRVTGFQVTVVDNDDSWSIFANLMRVNTVTGGASSMAFVDTSSQASSPDLRYPYSVSITDALVDIPTYAYYTPCVCNQRICI